MFRTVDLVCFVLVSLTCCQASIPSISPCRSDDEQCLISTAEILYPSIMDGDSDAGTEVLDPVWINKIDASINDLKCRFQNSTVTGYANCKIKQLSIDTNFKIRLECPRIDMTGHYDMDGRLIIVQVQGDGYYNLTVRSYKINIESDYEVLKTDDNKEYMRLGNFKYNASTEKGAHFYFDNLFNGRRDLGDTVLRFANENSIEVLNLLQNPILAATFKIFIRNVNKFLKAMPMEQLFVQ